MPTGLHWRLGAAAILTFAPLVMRLSGCLCIAISSGVCVKLFRSTGEAIVEIGITIVG